jgi:hypothetical protein
MSDCAWNMSVERSEYTQAEKSSINFNQRITFIILLRDPAFSSSSPCVPRTHSLTSKRRRSRNRTPTNCLINIVQNPRITCTIRPGKSHSAWTFGPRAISDIYLRTFHVELSASYGTCRMESDEFGTQEVLSRGDAGGDGDGLLADGGVRSVTAQLCAKEGYSW